MMMTVDAHARIGHGREESRAVDTALGEMDVAGVATAWVCPPDVFVAIRNREGNDFIAQTVAQHPTHFVGCAVANPWYGDEAIAELRRAHANGLRVLFLCPPVQGFQLSDPLADPLVAAATALGMPVYAHTGTPVCAEPFQLAALARRHPRGKFIMGHMGYADFWYDGALAAATAENIWLETSLIDGDLIADAVRRLGAGRVLFGSAAPFSDLSVEVAKILDMDVPHADVARILSDNARGLVP